MTQKTLTVFTEVITDEETEVADSLWFQLVVGHRASDGRTISELRTWKHGKLEDVVCDFFDARLRENPMVDRDWPQLVEKMAAAHLEAWIENVRHG